MDHERRCVPSGEDTRLRQPPVSSANDSPLLGDGRINTNGSFSVSAGVEQQTMGMVSYFSSGTTGSPKQVTFSGEDWAACVAHRADYLQRIGVKAGDSVALMISFGPWFSGDNITEALLQIGARVMPLGIHPGHILAAGELIRNLRLTTIITTPSLAMTLADADRLPEQGRLVLVGESVSPILRKQLSARKGLEITSLYAASEAIIGYEDPEDPGIYRWDPKYLHLEVQTEDGQIAQEGVGPLLLTRRYGTAMRFQRHLLGDIVELLPVTGNSMPGLRFLGRKGHGFGLTTGVQVSRASIESFLDETGLPVKSADISVNHGEDGRDLVRITLETSRKFSPEPVKKLFAAMSLELSDLSDNGYLSIEVEARPATALGGKRFLSISERPWQL